MSPHDNEPPAHSIVLGQRVQPVKVERARELRRSMTRAERILWERLRANRLERLHWRRQQLIAGFIVDFYCHSAGVILELDGDVHTLPHQAEYDQARDAALSARNLVILRFSNAEVTSNINGVLARIRDACRERMAKA